MIKGKPCIDTEELDWENRKSCPFCGSTMNIVMQTWINEYKVLCLRCGCTAGASKTQAGAIERWNRRPIIIEPEEGE